MPFAENLQLLIACAISAYVGYMAMRDHKKRLSSSRRRSSRRRKESIDFAALNSANQHLFTHHGKRALVDAELHALVDSGAFQFQCTKPVPRAIDLHTYVQPASIDLPVTGSAFLVKEKVLPFHHKVIDLLDDLTLERKPLSGDDGDGVVLLKGQTYLVYCGIVHLPKDTKGCLSPKSSIGRVDLLVRGVVDGIGLYDTIPGGSARSLWLEITPRSFNVRINEGLALTQLMVFRSCDADEGSHKRSRPAVARDVDAETPDNARDSAVADETVTENENHPLIFNEVGAPLPHSWENGALVLCLSVPDVSGERDDDHTTTIGYEAISTNEVIDLSKVRCHDWRKYFRRIVRRETPHVVRRMSEHGTDSGSETDDSGDSVAQHSNRRLTLEKDRFYILATKVTIAYLCRLGRFRQIA